MELPQSEAKPADQQNIAKPADQQNLSKANLPKFDETNSKKVTWDQLPAQLRNATRLENAKEQPKVEAARGVKPLFSTYSYYVGPWGGNGGYPYYIYPAQNGSRIVAIAVRSGAYIDRFTIWYMDPSGHVYMGGDRGGDGGSYYIQFFDTDEYIYYVYGRSGDFIDHLTIYTNKKWFSYGGWGGSPFYVSAPAGYQVLGFFGGSGQYVDRMGFYMYTK